MNVDEFIESVRSAAGRFLFDFEILTRTDNAVKIRMNISDNIFIQFYYNQESGTHNYVVVGWNKRHYGRDCIGGDWHRHPFEDPSSHDTSEEGKRKITPLEFLDEVWKILHDRELL